LFWNPLAATYPTMCGPTNNTQAKIPEKVISRNPSAEMSLPGSTIKRKCTEGKGDDLFLLKRHRLKVGINMRAPRDKPKNPEYAPPHPREGKEAAGLSVCRCLAALRTANQAKDHRLRTVKWTAYPASQRGNKNQRDVSC